MKAFLRRNLSCLGKASSLASNKWTLVHAPTFFIPKDWHRRRQNSSRKFWSCASLGTKLGSLGLDKGSLLPLTMHDLCNDPASSSCEPGRLVSIDSFLIPIHVHRCFHGHNMCLFLQYQVFGSCQDVFSFIPPWWHSWQDSPPFPSHEATVSLWKVLFSADFNPLFFSLLLWP